jgi:O-antigen/teichoic acid export membrane protein
VAIWILVYSIEGLIADVFRGFHRIMWASLFNGLIATILSLAYYAVSLFTGNEMSVDQVLIVMIIAITGSVAISIVVLWRKVSAIRDSRPLGDKPKIVGVLGISAPLFVTAVTMFLINRASVWVVGASAEESDIALYGSAARLVAIVSMPLLISNFVIPPIIAELYFQGKKKQLERAMRTTATITGIPALLASTIFIFFGAKVLSIFYGNFYAEAHKVLSLLSIGQIVNVFAGSCGMALMMTGHQKSMMIIMISCGLLTLGANIVIVEHYGIVGVAATTATGILIQNLCMLVRARIATGIWTHATINVGLLGNKDR